MMEKKVYYYPELDTLRFLAFLLVLVHHGEFWKEIIPWRILAKYGWMGVDLFLCLSAFLFTRLLYVEYQSRGGINIRNFYIRRAFRIWPLYFFFLGISTAFTVADYGWSQSLQQRFIGMLFFADNLVSAAWNYNVEILFAAHLWTISYEEQFYAVIPWVLRKLYQASRATSLMAIIGAFLAGSVIRAILINNHTPHPAIWVLPLTHFESILGGMVVGLGLVDAPLKKIPSWILLGAGMLALWQVTRLENVSTISWSLMLTYPLIGLGTSLILFAVMQSNLGFLTILLKNKISAYLGKISYGLYVYHIAGLHYGYLITERFISPDRLLAYPVAGLFAGLVVTILVSMISYHALERPFLRIKERFAVIESRPA